MIIRRRRLYTKQLIDWFEEREKIFAEIYSDCQVVVSIPVHNVVLDGPGGNATYQGNMLNYSMLKELMSLMLEQEQGRRKFSESLKKRLQELVVWEHEHPVPQLLPFWPWQQRQMKIQENILAGKTRPVHRDRPGPDQPRFAGFLSLTKHREQAEAKAEGEGD